MQRTRRLERDLLALLPGRIAGAVPALVVVEDDRQDRRRRAERPEHAGAGHRMAAHLAELGLGQRAVLEEHRRTERRACRRRAAARRAGAPRAAPCRGRSAAPSPARRRSHATSGPCAYGSRASIAAESRARLPTDSTVQGRGLVPSWEIEFAIHEGRRSEGDGGGRAAGRARARVVPKLAGSGIDVVVEPGAGEAASFTDEALREAGAELGDPWGADVVAKVRKPSADELGRLREGQVLIGFLQPLTDPEGIERLAARGVTAFAMESIPRITRAQPMDALSSQATVSGYKAVVLAADRLPRFLPMLMTAAGTVAPAKVLVIGAGVAGPAGDRDGAAARRRRLRLRRAAGREGAGREPRRDVPRARRRRRGDRGRLRAGALRGGAAPQQEELEERIADFDVVDHDGAHPRPAGAAADSARRRSSRCGPAR